MELATLEKNAIWRIRPVQIKQKSRGGGPGVYKKKY